jgi:hypothetical protein
VEMRALCPHFLFSLLLEIKGILDFLKKNRRFLNFFIGNACFNQII